MEKLINFLPNYETLREITIEEPEAQYIFRLITNFIQDYYKKVGNTPSSSLNEIFYFTNCLIEKMWEKINTGHFSEVSITTRKIYSFACYFKVALSVIFQEEVNIDLCNEYMDKATLIGCTENLYENNGKFLEELAIFLKQDQTLENATLPYIKEIQHKNFTCDIPILDSPSFDEFNTKHFKLQNPALIRNVINHWPALKKWRDLNYLLKITGNRTVPIEIGSDYASENWSQQLIKMKDFLRRQFGDSCNESTIHEVEYLAQHELFDQIPELKKDICIPDYCYCIDETETRTSTTAEEKEQSQNDIDIKAWFGPQNTISPMHHDPKNNILCQIFGTKKIILASPSYTNFLYPYDSKMLNNTSQINAEHIDFEKFPLTKNVKFLHLVLQEGECLYLPPKWWHYVKSLNKSFSVSFWW